MKKLLRKSLGKVNSVYKQITGENIERKRKENIARVEFYKNFTNPGDLCFDVGANVGNRIEPLLTIGAKVVAVEPQEKCYKKIQKTYGDKVILVTEGLGECECEKDFYIADTTTISSFSEEWIKSMKEGRFNTYDWSKTVRVKITTLDNLIEKYGVPKFIKIDVEGYELEVLKGLSSPIKFVSFEYIVPEQTHRAKDCIKRLETIDKTVQFNYSIGESMEWALSTWLSGDDMCSVINSQEFTNTGFGDIYARSIN